jgi:hypothetical protein
MRTTVPPAFDKTFAGPEGTYILTFRPTDEWDGIIDVSIAGSEMRWAVVDADVDEAGGVVLGGMTSGSESLWNDQFWFELRLDDAPPVIRYWGDQVVWREDRAV